MIEIGDKPVTNKLNTFVRGKIDLINKHIKECKEKQCCISNYCLLPGFGDINKFTSCDIGAGKLNYLNIRNSIVIKNKLAKSREIDDAEEMDLFPGFINMNIQ